MKAFNQREVKTSASPKGTGTSRGTESPGMIETVVLICGGVVLVLDRRVRDARM